MHIQNRRQARRMIRKAKAAYYAAVDEAQLAISDPPDYGWYERAMKCAEAAHATAEKVFRECGVTVPRRFQESLVWASSLDPNWLHLQYGIILPKIAYS